MATQQDLVAALRQADAAGDTVGAQRIAGMIRAQNSAPQHGQIAGERDLGPAGNAAMAAGIHAVHQIPVLGDLGLAAGRWARGQLAGEGTTWDQANHEVRQIVDSAQEQHPVASTVGGVAGGLSSAALGGEALEGASGGRLALQAGEHAANVGRLAASGAIAGGVVGGGQQLAQGHPDQALPAAVGGAAMGAVTAPLAAGAGRVAVAGARRVAAPLTAKTALALSKVFGENPSDLQAAWRSHVDATGRPPSMAELATYKQQGVIRGMAKSSVPISDALQANADQAAADRSARMQGVFKAGGAASPADLANTRTQQGDVDYPAARGFHFSIPTAESADLGGVSPADHIAAEILPQSGLGKADRVRILDGLKDGRLSGQDAQLVRSGLSESLSRNYSPAVKGYLSDLEGILGGTGNEDANAALQQATANFASNSSRIEGAQHGAGILGSETPASFAATADAKPNSSPEFAPGMRLGANDKLSSSAATPQGATSLAQRLATDDGLFEKLTTTFGASDAAALRRLGVAESASASAMSPYSRAASPEDDKAALKDVGQVAAAVASHGLGWKAYHAAKVFAGLDMPANVQAKVAEYLSNPKMAQQGINLLAKAGASNQRLRQLALTAAVSGGILSGDAASSTVSESQP